MKMQGKVPALISKFLELKENAPANKANLVSLHTANNANLFKDAREGMEKTDEHNTCETLMTTEQKVWQNVVSLFPGCFSYGSWIRGIVSDWNVNRNCCRAERYHK